jgi:hypothetical protein
VDVSLDATREGLENFFLSSGLWQEGHVGRVFIEEERKKISKIFPQS